MEKIPVRQIKEPTIFDNFRIRDVESLLSAGVMVQELHRHDFFFALMLEKGTGEHIIDFIKYSINDYSVFFMRPGQVHQLLLKKGSKGYLMEFNAGFYMPHEKSASQILRKVSYKNYCQLDSVKFKKLLSVLAYIFQEYSERQEKYQEVIKANLEILFIELARQSQNPEKLSPKNHQYAQERLEEFLALLQIHISSHKQVSQYADMLHLTTYQLNAIIKETLGKTCSALINEHIILEAKRQLLATSNQINQIAWELGYEDVSYFIRFFRKHTTHTPEAFRMIFK